jgi:uncharacterized protein (TIRG00374 family)
MRVGDAMRTRTIRFTVQVVIAALAVYLLLPQFSGLHDTLDALARATWWLILIVVTLEVISSLSYGELLGTVLAFTGEHVRWSVVQRVALAGRALSKTMPGGSAAALTTVTTYLSLTGGDPPRVVAALGASGLLSMFILALLLPAAAALALLGRAPGPVLGVAGVITVLILIASLLTRPALRNGPAVGDAVTRALATLRLGRLWRRIDAVSIGRAVERAISALDDLTRDRGTLGRAASWGMSFWICDVLALAGVAVTVGRGTPVWGLLLAYVAGQLIAAVPLTPGGVGLMESAMIGTLVAQGAPGAAATATVLGWRIANNWLPLVAGLALIPTLPFQRAAPSGSRVSVKPGEPSSGHEVGRDE